MNIALIKMYNTQIPMMWTCIMHMDVYLKKTHILSLIIIYNYDMNTTSYCTLSQSFISSMCLIICVNILVEFDNFLPPCKIICYAKKKNIYHNIYQVYFFSLIRNIMDEHTANVVGKQHLVGRIPLNLFSKLLSLHANTFMI